MARVRRCKQYDFIYHVMIKSISEVPMFRENTDRDKYIEIMKNYMSEYGFRVYSYCFMDNHAHFIIDANGADISKFMHGINQTFAQAFNSKHGRVGHLFHDRFKSKVVDSEAYLFTLSGYIHNNPTSIKSFKTCPERYKYSSLGVYLGFRKDSFNLVDESFVMGFFSGDIKKARENYYCFIFKCTEDKMKNEAEFQNEVGEYRSERIVLERKFTPQDIMQFICKYTNTSMKILMLKYNRESKKIRALCIYLIRYYCDSTYKEICYIIGGLTLSRVAELSNFGFEIIKKGHEFGNIMDDFLIFKAA